GHGLHFPQKAAAVRIPFPEAIAVAARLFIGGEGRVHGSHEEPPPALQFFFELVRFGKEKTGGDKDQWEPQAPLVSQMGEDDAPGSPETARNGGPRTKGVGGPA